MTVFGTYRGASSIMHIGSVLGFFLLEVEAVPQSCIQSPDCLNILLYMRSLLLVESVTYVRVTNTFW
jgi:hypothetical protein